MSLTSLLLWSSFILGSVAIVFISRKSLRDPHSHGFFRFFAWEILWGLFLLNVEAWFREPWVWHQLVSWMLLIVASGMAISGFRLLGEIGRKDLARSDSSLLGLEKTSTLVTVGLYHTIRHPLYSSLLFLNWAIFFKSPTWLDAGMAIFCTLFLVATARAEERENVLYFGDAYLEYMQQTRMFIPYVL
jgi:protein-S-isoprenylcysteine O-methyltransferase Ste14